MLLGERAHRGKLVARAILAAQDRRAAPAFDMVEADNAAADPGREDELERAGGKALRKKSLMNSSVEGITKPASSLPRSQFCFACFNGNYPVSVQMEFDKLTLDKGVFYVDGNLKVTAKTTKDARPQSISRISKTPAKMAIVLLVGRHALSEARSRSLTAPRGLPASNPKRRTSPIAPSRTTRMRIAEGIVSQGRAVGKGGDKREERTLNTKR